MEEEEAGLVPISALEHWSYCPRQYALIHRDQVFEDNVYSAQGRIDHQRVDLAVGERAPGVRVERALPIWSVELGLIGRADVVEFAGDRVYPVEYKHGRKKPDRHADLQLCAQAMCLEGMLGLHAQRGAVYHVSSRQRREVECTPVLRERVRQAVQAIRRINAQQVLPPPVADRRCPPCSLVEICMPWAGARPARLRAQHQALFEPSAPRSSSEPSQGRGAP